MTEEMKEPIPTAEEQKPSQPDNMDVFLVLKRIEEKIDAIKDSELEIIKTIKTVIETLEKMHQQQKAGKF